MRALSLETIGASKSFGSFCALDGVSMKVRAGSVHALLGENGAGKSTLVKGIVGYGPLDDGSILIGGREQSIQSPRDAHALGIGMVYQHFTVAPGLSVAENLVLSRGELPWRIDWKSERARLTEFMARMPFKLDVERAVSSLAAGEKQKLEILKQLYLDRRFIILDEPTSVLTPQEAEEVLGLMRDLTRAGDLSVLMITHKFSEVTRFADDVTVLRRGKLVGSKAVADTDESELSAWMMGESRVQKAALERVRREAERVPGLDVSGLQVANDRGTLAVKGISLSVLPGEIVGIAGISGNGQKELTEALLGQRRRSAGEIRVNGRPYQATRVEMQRERVYSLPEEPLRNACIAGMSVAENLALRDYDHAPLCRSGWLINRRAIRQRARELISRFQVRPDDPDRPIGTLSGGNVQRAVLARELAEEVSVLIVSNPVFGLDFASVELIHRRLLEARNRGAAVLLLSEDLDELLELSDRILVIHDGEINHQTVPAEAERHVLGRYMAGTEQTGQQVAS